MTKLSLSYTEKKRLRANFGQHIEKLKIPNLLSIQSDSYEKFTQNKIKNPINRKDIGLENVFKNIFPIFSNNKNIKLEYISYSIGKSLFNTSECKTKGITYAGPLKIKIKLTTINKTKKDSDLTKFATQEIYILDMPLMTSKSTFIINGTERVIVSQLHRSPGLFFETDKNKSSGQEKLSYIAKIIPHRGSWLDIEFDSKNCIFARIDKKRKFPASIILKALNMNTEQILSAFFEKISIKIEGDNFYINNITEISNYDLIIENITTENNHIETEKYNLSTEYQSENTKNKNINKIQIKKEYLLNKVIVNNIKDETSEKILILSNTKISADTINVIINKKIEYIHIINPIETNHSPYILNTLKIDTTKNQLDALTEIYKILRPGEPSSKDSSKILFENLFFSEDKYDLSLVGRMKFNKRLNQTEDNEKKVLSKNDIINVIKKIIEVKNEKDTIDDIDNLGNRRIRSVGEIIENQFKIGFSKIEKSIKEKLNLAEYENLTPQDIINAKPIANTLREFFCSSQLSQFMDQNNPLSEITHKRRISALGPGGLTRDRAGFEVRDVHITHYGRVCPIETPEGPNIGLINSLAMYAKANDFGFLETPYVKIENKKVTSDIIYLSAIDESEYIIAQANAKIDKLTNILVNEFIPCRYKNEFTFAKPEKIQLMDVSPKQIVSVAAALIPFLEHDDANRALMGSNMQRQAVPVINSEKPLVGTGIERTVAIDSGVTVIAKRGGIVDKSDSSRIIIKSNIDEIKKGETGVDIYNLIKFTRSNYNTCINQKPIVKEGEIIESGDVIADGPATDLGELALGQNLLVAFMPWNGYNFEDSIIISENVVKKNILTSIHIEELICISRDLKLGPEEITPDIPNVNETNLSNLDESGIIYIGSKVKPGDILVGKVTQTGESQLTPEEKLLQAIFGEKASDVKDTSLRVPTGIKGNIIDVQIFTRDGVKKDLRTLKIEKEKFKKIKKDLSDELRILKEDIFIRIKKLLINNYLKDKENNIINNEYINNLKLDQILNIETNDYNINKEIALKKALFTKLKIEYEKKLKIKETKIKQTDELSPGIIKIIKISIAMKRKIQVGDKISGRHGNKGVVSTIIPIEDMPYMSDGTTIDIILNPLGVPSRMNVGQVLETHLGWCSKELGKKLATLSKTATTNKEIINFLNKIYNSKNNNINFESFNKTELDILLKNLEHGIPMSTPVFDGINENEIKELLKLADLPTNGKTILYDGRTGLPFENEITVGYKYIMKLNHLIDDKMHARSTGSYSLVSQQPLGGKAQFGGQRFGEMEVWALEAYGAAYTLQEMLTIKSDDISGRTKIYKNMIDNNYQIETGIPEAFNVLSKEILSLGLNIELENE